MPPGIFEGDGSRADNTGCADLLCRQQNSVFLVLKHVLILLVPSHFMIGYCPLESVGLSLEAP